jgi:hypothetical protein
LTLHGSGYELGGNRRDNRVTVGAQSSHAIGNPMSQRECAGFNWPPLSIPAQEPVSISPEAVKRAGCVVFATPGSFRIGLPRDVL